MAGACHVVGSPRRSAVVRRLARAGLREFFTAIFVNNSVFL